MLPLLHTVIPKVHQNIRVILVIIYLTIIFTQVRFKYDRSRLFDFKTIAPDISCHFTDEDDVLPAAEDVKISPGTKCIFFHETSCRGGIDSRQACAVESAARLHPTWQIHLMFSSPVTNKIMKNSCLTKLFQFPNVRVSRVHALKYCENTSLRYVLPYIRKYSRFPVSHASDILRIVTLNKWGGIYMDLDFITVRSLDNLAKNWVAKEEYYELSAGVMAFAKDELGQNLTDSIIRELNSSYKPYLWAHNGPGTITAILQKRCDPKADESKWSAETCQGLEVYGHEYFYPVHYENFKNYFKPPNPGLLESVRNAYAHHFWSRLSKDYLIKNDSYYAIIAQKYCPSVYKMYGDKFGF